VAHDFEVRMEVELDASPEQVWEAIASGPGIDSWFMGRTQVEARQGGAVRTDLGGYVQESVVTAWEPRKRFGYRTERGDDGSFLALEWIIEGREGASTVVRSVGCGFIGNDDWEAEYHSLKAGGAFYFHNLSQYLTYFAGRTGTPVEAAVPLRDAMRLWPVLKQGLGLPDTVAVGDQVRLTPAGLAPVEGVVDYSTPEFLGVRTDNGLYRFFPAGGGAVVTVGHHIFNPDVDQKEAETAWRDWLTALFG
jgi:uncharacterized protein YndB with AHSA1/START domain